MDRARIRHYKLEKATMVDLTQLSDAELIARISGIPEEQEVVQWL